MYEWCLLLLYIHIYGIYCATIKQLIRNTPLLLAQNQSNIVTFYVYPLSSYTVRQAVTPTKEAIDHGYTFQNPFNAIPY